MDREESERKSFREFMEASHLLSSQLYNTIIHKLQIKKYTFYFITFFIIILFCFNLQKGLFVL